MIGVKVVKLFDGVPYVGRIISFDPVEKYYKVKYYADDDEQELEFGELRVDEWKKLDRRQVLWLDEKHKKVLTSHPHIHLHHIHPH